MKCKNCKKEMGKFKVNRNGKIIEMSRWRCQRCLSHLTPKQKAHYLNKKYPERIKILKACKCQNKKKINHHPDYEKPYEVEILCFSCHWHAHEKIKPGFNTKQPNGKWNLEG